MTVQCIKWKIANVLDIRRLKYFKAIAECSSMTEAARRLNVAQPSLSSHIGDIERYYGVILFERMARGVKLTPAGKRLLGHAEVILKQMSQAEAELRQLGRAQSDTEPVRLGLLPSWGASLTPAIIKATAERLPQVALSIVEMRNEVAVLALLRQEIDLAVILEDPTHGALVPIAKEPLLYVTSAPTGAPVTFAQIAQDNLVLPPPFNPLRKHIDAAAIACGKRLEPVMEIDGQDTIKSAIKAGVGASIMTWNSIRDECIAGTLAAQFITEPTISRDVFLGYSRQVSEDIIAAFSTLLRDLAAEADQALARVSVTPVTGS